MDESTPPMLASRSFISFTVIDRVSAAVLRLIATFISKLSGCGRLDKHE